MPKLFNSTVLFYLLVAVLLAAVIYPAPFVEMYELYIEPTIDKAAIKWVELRELELVKETADAQPEPLTE